MAARHLRLLHLAAFGLMTMLLAACKFESGGSPPPPPPSTPSAYTTTDAALVSNSGSLTLNSYANTTSAIGGVATNSEFTLVHEETTP